MESGKMSKEKTILFYQIFFITLLIIFAVGIVKNVDAGPNSGSEIVSTAQQYLGRLYETGQPPNKEWQFGGVFDLGIAWTSEFDCSGLVSLAAGLRRHYSVEELSGGDFLEEADWSAPQTGDVLIDKNFDHVMIFESFVNNGTSVKVIQASYGELEVIESTWSLTWFQSHYYVYRFKTDSTNPTINFLGVQDGGVYNNPVTVGVSADDDTSEPTPGLYFYGQDSGGKFRQKQFTEEGTYTITGHAGDWVKNPADKTISFTIKKCNKCQEWDSESQSCKDKCDTSNPCDPQVCDPTQGCVSQPKLCPDVACMNNLGCQNGGCQYSPIKCPPRRCAMGVCSGGSCQYTQNRCPDENEFVSVGAPFTTISFNEHAPVGVL